MAYARRMARAEAVLLVPGIFGFGAFGPRGRPLVEYWARVEEALRRACGASLRFAVHEPPPAGSLTERVASLHVKLSEVLETGLDGRAVGRLHLVGHSTGGLDARLALSPGYAWPGLPEGDVRRTLLARVGTLVTLSAPFHGTPLAARLALGTRLLPALYFASILATRGRLRLAGQLATLFAGVKRLLLGGVTPTDELIARLADVDDHTARDIRRFLVHVADDHALVRELAPGAMSALETKLSGGRALGVKSFVTVSPPPRLGPADALYALGAPLQRALYDFCWAATASAGAPEGARLPAGPWLGGAQTPIGWRSSDGVVPCWSQTLSGEAAGLVEADHLDVIGHYESAGATFLRSGSRFDDARFFALWRAIGESLD